MIQEQKHIPVMLGEVLQALAPEDNAVYVDATFGNGGYSEAILQAANCQVIALDRDPNVLPRAQEMAQKYGQRFQFVAGCFGDIENLIEEPVDGFVFDIGVSSMQLDQAERGFSFGKEGPLDMRMSAQGVSAADIVNSYAEQELADLIYQYGEERKSRQIARQIVEDRKTTPFTTTTQLAQTIYKVLHKVYGQIDPATRTFQALRIAVNDELGQLQSGLDAAAAKLKAEGRLVVVDFHSLEDRLVKNFFNKMSGKTAAVSRYAPPAQQSGSVVFSKISKAIQPTTAECDVNPRARSAKLRFGIKSAGGNHD